MKLESRALGVVCALAAVASMSVAACTGTDDIHQTDAVRNEACYDCHSTAYQVVKTPKHVGVYPTTCGDCHSTNHWVPASGGHPESKFPITTGSHANKAIACADCHIASRGLDALGANCDCVHCHIGAHNTPAVDTVHTGVAGYPGSMLTSPPSCLKSGCHPTG
jgi:hypothetical protein